MFLLLKNCLFVTGSKIILVKCIGVICIKILFHDFQGGFVKQSPIVHCPEEVKVGVGVLVHPGIGHQVGEASRQVLLVLRDDQPVVLTPEKCNGCCDGLVVVFGGRAVVPPGNVRFRRSPV